MRRKAIGKMSAWEKDNENSFLGDLCLPLAVNHKSTPFRRPQRLGCVPLCSENPHLESLLKNGLEK